jgi:hypothetical protein
MDEAERAVGVLRRYVTAKARIKKHALAGTDFIGLRKEIEAGIRLFEFLGGAILIDPKAPHVITADDNAPKFFEAIIGGQDAIDIDDLPKWRE